MPELPEVESTVRYLRERMLGLKITEAEVHWARTIDRPRVREFHERIGGCAVKDITRRGKFIVIALEKDKGSLLYLLGHLRMSGSMDVIQTAAPPAKHDRVILRLEGGRELRFNDPRKFGRFYLVKKLDEVLGKLGHEPLDPQYSSDILHGILRKKRGVIKSLLLDQSILAGVGNIYADECLWRSRIHPCRRGSSLSRDEVARLLAQLRVTLLEAIEAKGTDAGDGVVEGGLYRPRVYGREGEACHQCRTSVRRIVVGQRGTHFCPRCQRLRGYRKQGTFVE